MGFIIQTTLSTFLVSRNRSTRRKPITFDKALTNSFQYDTFCFELFYRLDKTNAQMAKFEAFVAYNEVIWDSFKRQNITKKLLLF